MHCKSYSHFFSKKFRHICVSLDVNFNESLTNDVVSFEQLGPGAQVVSCWRGIPLKSSTAKFSSRLICYRWHDKRCMEMIFFLFLHKIICQSLGTVFSYKTACAPSRLSLCVHCQSEDTVDPWLSPEYCANPDQCGCAG